MDLSGRNYRKYSHTQEATMRALVTGGAGFIGSHVVDVLIKAGHEVVVIDDLSGGFKDNVNPKATFWKMSVTDTESINALFKKCSFDYVYHIAAYAAEGLSHFIRHFNYTNNVLGSINLINAAVNGNCKCFVFTSSIAVYGSGQTPMVEHMTPSPEDPYGIAKYTVELDLEAAHKMYGLNYIIFRPHNVYGERQNIGDPYRNVVGIFMNQIMQKRPCTVFGDGTQTRAFTYIDDVSSIIANSVFNKKAYNEIFNIGARVPYSVNQLKEEVQRAMGEKLGFFNIQPDTVYLPARKEVLHAFSDHSKLERCFGALPIIPLHVGLARMARWAVFAGIRTGSPFNNIEIERELPESWRQLKKS